MATRKFRIKIDGKVVEAEVEEIIEGVAPVREIQSEINIEKTPVAICGGAITAPMPGKIIAIKCSKGQRVSRGDILIILEAMKMEQEIKANTDGTISEIKVSEGMTVQKEEVLVIIG